MKIVSLVPSATEIVYALGLGASLEAVTIDCDYPPEVREKPLASDTTLPQGLPMSPNEIDAAVAGKMQAHEPLYRLDRALIQRIRPDLILAQDLCAVCAVPSGEVSDALEQLGSDAEVVSLDPHDLAGVMDGIEAVGKATGTDAKATELAGGLRDRVEAVRTRAGGLPSIRTLMLEWSEPPWVGGHWIPDMVEIAGGVDVLGEKAKPSRRATWGEIGDAMPEVVVSIPCGFFLDEAEDEARRLLAEHHELAETPAGRTGAVFASDASAYFSRPGPRLVDGLEALAWAIHPQAFPDPPAGRIVKVA